MEIALGRVATRSGKTGSGIPAETDTVSNDPLVVVGDDGFQAAMCANRALAGRLLLCFSAAEVLERDLPLAGDDVLVSAEALRDVRARRTPEFPGAGLVVVVDGEATADDPLGSPLSVWQRGVKRAFDIVVAVTALLLTAPVVVALAVASRLTLREPGFFVQERVGARGRTFPLRKIRTMVTADDAEHRAYARALIRGEATQVNGMFKLVHDQRITRLGRWLRRLSLDELPQLWNVLRGDMSLIGPRPPLPSEVAEYDAIAWQRLRVKPGITGAWQVGGRCTLSFAEMIELDLRYWQEWSLRRDIAIAVRTPLVMLRGKGAG